MNKKTALSPTLITIVLVILLLPACNTARILDKNVARYYGNKIDPKKIKSDYITISSPLKFVDDFPSTSTKKAKKILPLILYMRFYYETTCQLNPQMALNTFGSTFSTYANTKRLKEKLNGGKIELNIEKVPQYFSYNDDESMYLLLITVSKFYLKQQEQSLELSYTITGADGSAVKTQRLVVKDPGLIKGARYFQSLRSLTREYLTGYDETIKAMARKAVEEIVAGL